MFFPLAQGRNETADILMKNGGTEQMRTTPGYQTNEFTYAGAWNGGNWPSSYNNGIYRYIQFQTKNILN